MSLGKKVYMNEEKLWRAFKFFDMDNSDYITETNLVDALKKVGKKISEGEVRNMMQMSDTNTDNKISFEEFKQMMSGDWPYFTSINS